VGRTRVKGGRAGAVRGGRRGSMARGVAPHAHAHTPPPHTSTHTPAEARLHLVRDQQRLVLAQQLLRVAKVSILGHHHASLALRTASHARTMAR
jgi:hypothetical protein